MTANEHPSERWSAPRDWPIEPSATEEPSQETPGDEPPPPAYEEPLPALDDQPALFQHHYEPPHREERIPNFGHLLILGGILLVGLLLASLLTQFALHKGMFGITSVQKAVTDIHYTLGSEIVLYVFTLAVSLFVFPLFWHKSLFAGLQWNGATAIRLRTRLVGAAVACLALAAASSLIAPGPTNAPIDKIFRAPGAAWLLFIFGITFAPFFEEMFFRGFLLPALCTVVDWCNETIAHKPRRPLGPDGHPQWSFAAMAVGALATSIPFAMMHAEQTGYSVGPFILLVGVSLVLCGVRLATRSLASSTLVHACYNFVLFSVMLVGTHGFKHLDRM